MRNFHNSELKERATDLRKNSTKEERKLWYRFLRALPKHFCRQKVIGHYIVDFYCAAEKLVIELDGSQHFEDAGQQYDKQRDEFLQSLGLTVVRYSNLEIQRNFKNVCQDILNRVGLE